MVRIHPLASTCLAKTGSYQRQESYGYRVYDFEHPRYKPEQREEARRLRGEEGLSVGAIAGRLHVAKSSVSLG